MLKYKELASAIKQDHDFSKLTRAIENKQYPINIVGAGESSAAAIIFALRDNFGSALIVAPDGVAAKALYKDLELLLDDVYLFEERELLFYDIDYTYDSVFAGRAAIYERLCSGGDCVVVASVSALLSPVLPKQDYIDNIIKIKSEQKLEPNKLDAQLIAMGYTREFTAESKGQFAMRGSIIDIVGSDEAAAIRIDMFGDEIDSIRVFDVTTQRSLDVVKECTITPCTEIILDADRRKKLIAKVEKLVSGGNSKLAHDLERLQQGISFPSIDKYIPAIYGTVPTLFEYMPDCATIIIEPNQLEQKASTFTWDKSNIVADLKEKQVLPADYSDWYVPYEGLVRVVAGQQKLIGMLTLPTGSGLFSPRTQISLSVRQQTTTYGKPEFLFEALRQYIREDYSVVVLAGQDATAANMSQLIADSDFSCALYANLPPLKPRHVHVITGALGSGCVFTSAKLAIICDHTLFGNYSKPKKMWKSQKGARIQSYMDLTIGDLVVHQNHGIAKYMGINTMNRDGTKSDYLKLAFGGTDTLYLPVNQLDLLYKYIGNENTVKLNKLNSSEWVRTKARVKKDCSEMAEKLIKLYALRENMRGISFAPDNEWQAQFEEAFVYDETEDQLRCIEEVKRDMEKSMPMDRLLCGDVGFGKTEVALRAAFKAVSGGYQVAYLVPTTILASQHFATFKSRMEPFGIRVAILNRFISAKTDKHTLSEISKGNVDIVIGTHRLLQKDIGFKKLGLLIVDEEQRFGVVHKEQIKVLRNNVDVLTLSATPIPRTLHMSLIGVRDMSLLENPPRNRYPISTFVCEYNDDIVKDAILREVARGGQVYYLHNRVQTIDKVAERIQSFSPNLRVTIGHGKHAQLEEVMENVLQGNVDVLVCTTIIETGLDIPNINTIIIEDADKMGLAQLYQLRGRVGRSSRLAYCYLTYRKDKVLTEIATKRLRAIREFTEFGSGFKIALRDLEIRGAGNIVGEQQHGHMDAVGYDMYCKLLSEAVAELKGLPPENNLITTVSLNVDAYIDTRYIQDDSARILIYKRIADIESQQDALDVYDEITDRYGEVPAAVNNLIQIVQLRHIAKRLGISDITQKSDSLKITYSPGFDVNVEAIIRAHQKFPRAIKLNPNNRESFTFSIKSDCICELRDLLTELDKDTVEVV